MSQRPDISAITTVKIKARHRRDGRESGSGLEDMAITSESLYVTLHFQLHSYRKLIDQFNSSSYNRTNQAIGAASLFFCQTFI
jgi:hypothetical protein